MKNARVDRMLRELHAAPPLRVLDDLAALKAMIFGRAKAPRSRAGQKEVLGVPVLAGHGAVR